jgi:hypothetical protein
MHMMVAMIAGDGDTFRQVTWISDLAAAEATTTSSVSVAGYSVRTG